MFVNRITFQLEINITWDDWFDDLAGLQKYTYQIHTVSNRNNVLKEDGPLQQGGTGTIHLNETFVTQTSYTKIIILVAKYIPYQI